MKQDKGKEDVMHGAQIVEQNDSVVYKAKIEESNQFDGYYFRLEDITSYVETDYSDGFKCSVTGVPNVDIQLSLSKKYDDIRLDKYSVEDIVQTVNNNSVGGSEEICYGAENWDSDSSFFVVVVESRYGKNCD